MSLRGISELREEIDKIDGELLCLMEKRLRISEEIAEYKELHSIPVEDVSRERQKLCALRDLVKKEEDREDAQELFRALIEISKRHQRRFIERKRGKEQSGKPSFCDAREEEEDKALFPSLQKLVLYRNLPYRELIRRVLAIFEEGRGNDFYSSAGELIELAEKCGLEGNLWHALLALAIASDENPYSIACECGGEAKESVSEIVLHDFCILKELFDYDPEIFEDMVWERIRDYRSAQAANKDMEYGRRINEFAFALQNTRSLDQFKAAADEFYKEFGAGNLGLNKAFLLKEAEGKKAQLEAIPYIEDFYFEDLIGYEEQKRRLRENTEAFLEGRAANNVLLFGEAGSGKSSSIKALINTYYERGLRIIELHKHQFMLIPSLLDLIAARNYRFIIYMDDLSFEEGETEYKYLKALMEGSMRGKPENVLVYASSNRRHLIRESFRDQEEGDEELHRREGKEEKLSLAERFGIRIYYGAPDKKEFEAMVAELARRAGIRMEATELLLRANQWELAGGGRSGRSARQLIEHLRGNQS